MTYLVIDSESARVTVHQRSEQGFVAQTYSGMDAVIPLDAIRLQLSLAELHEQAELTPEPDDDPENA